MITIKPFKGYRPPNDIAEKVAAVPYDVINIKEASELADGNPFSFLKITRSEIDLPNDVDVYSQEVYDKARSSFLEFVKDEKLLQDDEECFYLYKQVMDGKAQTGIVALSSTDDYTNGLIKKHEFTRPKKEEDRIKNMKTSGIHAGPVFCTFKKEENIDSWIEKQCSTLKPEVDFTANDSVQHTLWKVSNAEANNELINLFKTKVPATYIADGHHRAASSTKVAALMANENENHNGTESYNYMLTVLFPDDQLQIIDYNRLVKDLNGLSKADFLETLKTDFEVAQKNERYKPNSPYHFGLYIDNEWYELKAKPHTYDINHPIKALDVTVISDHLLDKVLGIVDQRTDDRIDFVGGIRGLAALEKRVDSGEFELAVAIYPVSIQQLIDIADSGNVMPPKSTWFEPKLRSGLVLHRFA